MSQADYIARYAKRQSLKEAVETYWIDEPRKPAGQLDSSLKKHTTLINRLKSTILIGPADALIKEIDGLTLSKYLEEIVGAVVEGVGKGRGDPDVAVEVIAHLHTRLAPEFFPLLLPPLLANFTTAATPAPAPAAEKDREKEDKERITRQRIILRLIAELALVLAWAEGIAKGAGEVAKILKALMNNDPTYTNISLIIAFVKHFDRTYLGPNSTNGGDEALPEGMEELVPTDIQKTYRSTLVAYFNGASKNLVKGQVRLLEQDKRNHEAYIKSGEIFEDRQHAYERMTKAVERLTTGVQSLADLLGLTMPDLPTSATLSKGGLQIVENISSFTVKDEGGSGIWDDDEERRFYEDLPDLRELVPSSLLGIKDKAAKGDDETSASVSRKEQGGDGDAANGETNEDAEQEKQKAVEEDIKRQLEQMSLENQDPKGDKANRHGNGESAVADDQVDDAEPAATAEDAAQITDSGIVGEEEGLQSGPAARLTALFAALPEAVNREMVDKLAVEFAFLNSKAARKRLVKFLAAVPKNRTDLLPHYARFIAILDRYMPDVGTGVIELLEEEMRYLQRKKAVRELDGVRTKNCRFYGELAKFKVARPYAILHPLKIFLDDFKPNIENIANLLETCGRFLLRNEGTAETAKQMVELMRRKQSNSHLDNRQVVMLENAFYQCNPPERVKREVVELPPMHSFIQHLLHDVLMKRTLDKVFKLLRKLHWEEQDVYDYLLLSFTEPWEIKYGNIQFLAALVHDLQRYHPEFSVSVVDQVMEDIRIGMEVGHISSSASSHIKSNKGLIGQENIFKHNQRRIATVRYLGELYMYRVVNANVIFETLWSLISFGHGEGLPVPGRDSPIDSVDDFFRVRLVCSLLDCCGICFDRGSQKRKLDHFLTVFQLYVVCKRELPMDVEFMLGDTLETLRPKAPRLSTFADAAAAVDTLLAEQSARGDTAEDSEDESDDEEEGERGAGHVKDEEDDNAHPVSIESDSEEAEDDVVVLREKPPVHDSEDEDARMDFDREFAKMLADTTDAKRGERKPAPIFDTAVPLIKRPVAVGSVDMGSRSRSGGDPGHANASAGREKTQSASTVMPEQMQFSLMSKKGNKQQIRDIAIPLDSAIAVNSRTHQLKNKAEQEQLKRLVLQNERRQGESEMLKLQDDMNRRGIRTRFTG